MITVIAEMTVADSAGAEKAVAAAIEVCRHTRQEPGCLVYTFARDVENDKLFRISELWQDAAALEAHLEQPYVEAFREAMAGANLVSISARMFDASNERDPMAEG